jgi:hypothetical protein
VQLQEAVTLDGSRMMKAIKATHIAIAMAGMGTLLALFVILFKRDGQSSSVWPAFFFIAAPWVVLDVLLVWLRWMRGIAIAGILMLALEVLLYVGVFLAPQSSTDAVVYAFKPGVQIFILLPIGLLIGRAMDKHSLKVGG